jgi:hypothetical protein
VFSQSCSEEVKSGGGVGMDGGGWMGVGVSGSGNGGVMVGFHLFDIFVRFIRSS